MKKITSLILALVLTFSLMCLFSCDKEQAPDESGSPSPWDSATYKEDTTLGSGAKTFTVEVCAYDKTVTFTISSDKEFLGDELISLGLVEGYEGAYGLYMERVNNILADYNTDKTYWALYIDGSYALTGIDTTPIESGKVYKLSREK